MTREQIKKIVRLTEAIVAKRLYESSARYNDTLLYKANDYIANVGDVTASQLAKYLKVDINTASAILRDMTVDEAIVNKRLSENADIDLTMPYGVISQGGSAGRSSENYYPKFKGILTKTYSNLEDAKAHAKRYNSYLSPGEKKYYGMKYVAVTLPKNSQQ